MKTLYLDCGMGAAGDMLAAALLELLPEPDAFVAQLNALGIPDVYFQKEPAVKCGICGTHFSVLVHGKEESCGSSHTAQHHPQTMTEIREIISRFEIPERVRDNIFQVYGRIAQAESQVHGIPVHEVHFHEVGSLDAIADLTAVCLLMDVLAPDEVVVSPVHVGSGSVTCAHGTLPVPAPATALLLKDVPIYGGKVPGELCTPTGAALLKHFATRFGDMPVMKVQAIGYGMGKKDFENANCVRAMFGETDEQTDVVIELSCNVDDMTAEEISFATERFFEAGAHEVYTVPIGMKKSRPGTLVRVMCYREDRENMIRLLFAHTTTLGVREAVMQRYVLGRRLETIQTCYGAVRCKKSSGYGVTRMKYEYEDLSRIAREHNMSLQEVRKHLPDG